MKRILVFLTITVLLVGAIMFVHDTTTASGTPGSKWFDMQHCAFYRAVAAENGLIDHMSWYDQPTETGLIRVVVVDPGFEEAYDRAAMAAFNDPGMSITGTELPLCPHCASLLTMARTSGTLVQSYIGIKGVRLTVLTSSDPNVVAMAHGHAKLDNEALQAK